jgi:hypothetical protein
MARIKFEINGLSNLKDLDKASTKISLAATQAINRTADRARAQAAREILAQINLPDNYVRAKDSKRLKVSKKAKQKDLEAVITSKARPTSLARFATAVNKKGVRVAVKPGGSKLIPNAFLLKLRSGSADLDTKSNQGLAVRTRKGVTPPTAYKPKRIADNLWLLYGPSVNQVFGGEEGVAQKVSPATANYLQREFERLLKL